MIFPPVVTRPGLALFVGPGLWLLGRFPSAFGLVGSGGTWEEEGLLCDSFPALGAWGVWGFCLFFVGGANDVFGVVGWGRRRACVEGPALGSMGAPSVAVCCQLLQLLECPDPLGDVLEHVRPVVVVKLHFECCLNQSVVSQPQDVAKPLPLSQANCGHEVVCLRPRACLLVC